MRHHNTRCDPRRSHATYVYTTHTEYKPTFARLPTLCAGSGKQAKRQKQNLKMHGVTHDNLFQS